MKSIRKIIIRIIVAVAVAFILSKFKVIGLMNVSAKTANTTFTYNNVLIQQNQFEFNFTSPFATNMKRGTLKTNVVITNNILPNTGDIPTTLRQAIVYNGTSTNVCSIGSVNTGSIFSESNQGLTNRLDVRSTTYTLECEVTPNPKIEKIVLYFSGTMNSARLSFGPNVSFRENDLLLQNETCFPSINLFSDTLRSGLTFYDTGIYTENNYRLTSTNWISLPSGTYTINAKSSLNKNLQVSNITFDENNNFYNITGVSGQWKSLPFTFTTTVPIKWKMNLRYSDDSLINVSQISNIQLEKGSSASPFEPYGEDICKNKQDLALEESQKQTQAQQETNDTIKNTDTTEANSKADSFFDGFESTSMGGVSDVITSPFRLLNSLVSSQCSPLVIPLPFVDDDVEIPCMSTIYSKYPTFYSLWQLVTTGLISYNVAINLYSKIKNMQNPKNDKIEVLNL